MSVIEVFDDNYIDRNLLEKQNSFCNEGSPSIDTDIEAHVESKKTKEKSDDEVI